MAMTNISTRSVGRRCPGVGSGDDGCARERRRQAERAAASDKLGEVSVLVAILFLGGPPGPACEASRRPSPALLPTRAAALYPTRRGGASREHPAGNIQAGTSQPGTFGDPVVSKRANSSRRPRAAGAPGPRSARAPRGVFHVLTVIVHCGTILRLSR